MSDASTVDLTVNAGWTSSAPAVATIDAAGKAHGVGGGTTTISAAIGALDASTVLTVTGVQPSTPETVTFAPLPDRVFGAADFALTATSSSGQPVDYAAAGSCSVAGGRVHVTGAGTCTITASRGSASVTRTFTIAKAGQTITFGALPGRTVGDADFAVSATASSGLGVTFSASGACTVSAGKVHLTGRGTCTITATQAGNANYGAAPAVARTFAIDAARRQCKVPNVVGRTLAAAKQAIKAAGCATGKVRRGYSGKVKKGKVVSQSRRPQRLYAAGTKIDLVVSRGRRR